MPEIFSTKGFKVPDLFTAEGLRVPDLFRTKGFRVLDLFAAKGKKSLIMYQFCLELKKYPCKGVIPLANYPDAAAFRSAASRRYQETNKISVIDVFNKLYLFFLILDDFSNG